MAHESMKLRAAAAMARVKEESAKSAASTEALEEAAGALTRLRIALGREVTPADYTF